MGEKIIARITFGLVGLTVFSALFLSEPVSFALTPTGYSQASITVSLACSLVANTTVPHNATIIPGHVASEIGNTNITAKCNDTAGSAVYAIGYSNSVWHNTNMVSSSNNTIPTGTGTSSSNWSMKLSTTTSPNPTIRSDASYDYTDYEVIPANYTLVASFPSSTDGVTNSTFSTTYRVYVDDVQIGDTYIGKVKYTLVHPSNAGAPEIPTLIQDITLATCPTTPLTVQDVRDDSYYRIAKLADGNCWMLDNLSLDIADPNIKSEINASNTNSSSEAISCLLYGTYNDVACTSPYSIAGATKAWDDGIMNLANSPVIAVDSSTAGPCNNAYCVNGNGTWSRDDNTPLIINNNTSIAQGLIGVYYNYCAASGGYYCYDDDAGVDNPDGVTTLQDSKYDICPKGWRLPTGGSSSEFYSLYNEFSSSTDQEADFQMALDLPLSGDFYNGKAFNQGRYGYWWTSTYGSAEDMYYFISSNTGSEPWNHDLRFLGLSIRCILDTSS